MKIGLLILNNTIQYFQIINVVVFAGLLIEGGEDGSYFAAFEG